MLLQAGANVSIRNNHEHSALYAAEQEGHSEIVGILKEHGAK